MAYVVVTSLLGIVDHQLLKRHPTILDDTAKSLSEKLGFVQAILSAKKTINQELEAKIRDVAVEAEAEIESHLGAVYLANRDSVAEASHGLHQILRKVLKEIESLEQLQSGDTGDCRWISSTSTYWPASHKVHSILYFGKDVHLAKSMLVFSGLKMLRVLDLSLIKCWYGLPNELEDLVHLRYLSLSALGSIGNFQLTKLRNLQTLIFRSWRKGCRLQLPRDILELPWLRHVHVDKISSLYLPQQVQENLQTLLWLKVIGKDPRTTDFEKVRNLKELWVYIDNELPHNAFDSLVHLHLLEKLKVEMGSVKRFYFPTALPKNLKKLTLRSTYLPWKDMDIIGRLKNLEVLKLKNFAFYGPEWELADGLFPELKLFVIAHSNLKCWNADENFPKLECLILKFCWDLKKLPIDSFGDILRLIEIDSCYPSLVESAKEIQEEQRDRGNDKLVIRDLGAKVEEEFKFVEVLQWQTIPREAANFAREELSNSTDSSVLMPTISLGIFTKSQQLFRTRRFKTGKSSELAVQCLRYERPMKDSISIKAEFHDCGDMLSRPTRIPSLTIIEIGNPPHFSTICLPIDSNSSGGGQSLFLNTSLAKRFKLSSRFRKGIWQINDCDEVACVATCIIRVEGFMVLSAFTAARVEGSLTGRLSNSL
nr:putative late blight resistance protein homolog R1B-14 [Ipomoea batatas]